MLFAAVDRRSLRVVQWVWVCWRRSSAKIDGGGGTVGGDVEANVEGFGGDSEVPLGFWAAPCRQVRWLLCCSKLDVKRDFVGARRAL